MSDFATLGLNSQSSSSQPIQNFTTQQTPCDIVFKIDVTGRLFKNKDTNYRVEDSLTYQNLVTRLLISKNTFSMFPELGLQDHLLKLDFTTETEIETIISDLESDATRQVGKSCSVSYDLDVENKFITLRIEVSGLQTTLQVKFSNKNHTVKIVQMDLIDN